MTDYRTSLDVMSAGAVGAPRVVVVVVVLLSSSPSPAGFPRWTNRAVARVQLVFSPRRRPELRLTSRYF